MYNISFIVPTYNNYKMLLRCVTSLVSQMSDNDEIIIIDDGSNDGTYENLVKKYKEKDNIIVLKQENSGSGTARNNGIENSTKEYIWFVDSDDYLLKESLKKARNILKEELDLIIFDFRIKTEDGEKDVNLDLDPKDKTELMLGLHFPWNKIIKKKLLKEIRFPTAHIRYQDHATIPAVLAQAKNIKYVRESFYVYDFSHENNISKQNKKNDHMYIAFENLIKYREKKIITEEEMDVLFIKSFIFSHLFQPKTTDFKQIRSNTEKIKTFLDKEYPEWGKSKCLKLNFGKQYGDKIKAIKIKIILGKILRYSILIPSVLVYFYLNKLK